MARRAVLWLREQAAGGLFLGYLLLLLSLTACASDPQVIHQRIYVPQEIPASLLTCAPWPQPDTLPQDVRGLVEWLARAKAAHMDCVFKLESVRGLVSKATP